MIDYITKKYTNIFNQKSKFYIWYNIFKKNTR